MAFTNKNNKITVKGFLSSNITEVPNSTIKYVKKIF